MAAPKYDIVIDQGSDFALSIIMKNDGIPVDLTGYSGRGQLRESKNAANPTASFVVTITDAVNGALTVEMLHSVSSGITAGVYWYDIEIYLGSEGSETAVTRLFGGKATVTGEITR